MLDRFSRTRLLLGGDALDILKSARVAVFGIGGVGSYTAEALVRSGVGNIDIIDDDRVCLTNINRQLFATSSTVGEYKVDVAEKRLLEINPDVKVTKHRVFVLPETVGDFDLTKYDYIVDLTAKSASLTQKGIKKAEDAFGLENFNDLENSALDLFGEDTISVR